MPVADPAFGWQEAVAAFAIITVAAFLVTWVLTDREVAANVRKF